jgi:hypothetical protein
VSTPPRQAGEPARASAAPGTVADRISLDALVVVAARRLVLGVDVAAAKLLSGQRIDDHVREMRPQFDIVNRHILLLLIGTENVPPVRRSDIDALFDRELRTSTALRHFGDLRRDATGVALRSLYRVL